MESSVWTGDYPVRYPAACQSYQEEEFLEQFLTYSFFVRRAFWRERTPLARPYPPGQRQLTRREGIRLIAAAFPGMTSLQDLCCKALAECIASPQGDGAAVLKRLRSRSLCALGSQLPTELLARILLDLSKQFGALKRYELPLEELDIWDEALYASAALLDMPLGLQAVQYVFNFLCTDFQ